MTQGIQNIFSRQGIGNLLFSLLIWVIILDPTNSVLHIKDIAFLMLAGYCIITYKPDREYFIHLILLIAPITISYIIAEMQQSVVDYGVLQARYKSLVPLILLLWIRHFDVVRLMIIPTCAGALFIVVLYAFACSSELVEYAMYLYFKEHLEMVMMSKRYILGFEIFGMYLKSFIDLIVGLFVVYYRTFNSTGKMKRIGYILLFILFTVAFFMSGTRSTMLLPFFMLGVVFFNRITKTRRLKYFLYPAFAIFAIAFVMLVLMLASEQGEKSNTIKFAHLTSYAVLFTDNPQYLLWGQGPGTWFYSSGFGAMTDETEWTYLELLRNYGLLCLPMLYVYILPLFRLWPHIRTNNFTFGIFCTYFCYLLIAGTNPLLMSSTGIIMVLMAYSYTEVVKQSSCIPDKKAKP